MEKEETIKEMARKNEQIRKVLFSYLDTFINHIANSDDFEISIDIEQKEILLRDFDNGITIDINIGIPTILKEILEKYEIELNQKSYNEHKEYFNTIIEEFLKEFIYFIKEAVKDIGLYQLKEKLLNDKVVDDIRKIEINDISRFELPMDIFKVQFEINGKQYIGELFEYYQLKETSFLIKYDKRMINYYQK